MQYFLIECFLCISSTHNHRYSQVWKVFPAYIAVEEMLWIALNLYQKPYKHHTYCTLFRW